MKRVFIYAAMALYIFAAAAGLISSYSAKDGASPDAVEPSSFAESEKPTGFIVRAVNGVVAVEDIGSGKIIKKTDTRVAILPEKDREQLETGIYAENNKKLRGLLEDLCS